VTGRKWIKAIALAVGALALVFLLMQMMWNVVEHGADIARWNWLPEVLNPFDRQNAFFLLFLLPSMLAAYVAIFRWRVANEPEE
jgi:hypothetical protein